MADTIKIGQFDVDVIKIGQSNVDAVFVGQTKVYPNQTPTHDYSLDYFTFLALENGTFTVKGGNIEYSLDGGNSWTTLTAESSTPTVTSGNKVLWRGSYSGSTSTGGTVHFSSTGRFDVQGNTMSILYGDNFSGQTSLGNSIWTFNSLFSGATGLTSAENMILPATTATQRCYNNIFSGCTSLTTPPEFPATTLGDTCYQGMFRNCTSFENVPEGLFSAATTMVERCYTNTFWGSGIKNLPKLHSTSLATQCYSGLFAGCTGITSIPEDYLPATTLATNCYYAMFSGCTNLTTASVVLGAPTLAGSCYAYMFNSCSKLSSITCLATNISASNCTNGWVSGVASSGIFKKSSNMSGWGNCGISKIPCNWTVENYSG